MTYPILQEGESLSQFYARIHDRGYVRVCTGCGTTRHASIVQCPCGNFEFVYKRTGQPPQVSQEHTPQREPDTSAVKEQAGRVITTAPESPLSSSESPQETLESSPGPNTPGTSQESVGSQSVASDTNTPVPSSRNPSLIAREMESEEEPAPKKSRSRRSRRKQ